MKTLILLAFAFLSAHLDAATLITFDPPSLPGGGKHLDDYEEQDFLFTTPNGLTHRDSDGGISPDNGTAYLRFARGPAANPLIIINQSNRPFDMLSVELAWYSEVFYNTPITFVGYRDGIEVARQQFNISSIRFTEFTFSESFVSLDWVEVLENGYALDNVKVEVTLDPPVIVEASAYPSTLWPPNQRLVTVDVSALVEGGSGNAQWMLFWIECDEDLRADDFQVVDDHTVRLRATRRGKGSGRTYTLWIIASDDAGNESEPKAVTVTVPHDQRRR